jgi:DNA-binding MarR family transcriptional regulator
MVIVTTEQELRQKAIERFWESIPAVWNQVRNNLRSIASEKFEISVEQFHILRHIRKGSASVSDLAAIRKISRPAISQAVDVLVEKGLITRQQDAKDRRFVNLLLTPDGDTLLTQIFQENRAWMMEKMQSLSENQLETIITAMETLSENFSE